MTAPRPTQPLRVRVLVADESEARFYNIAGPGEPLELRGQVSNPKAHLHDRDLKSDRPGRVFDRAPGTGRRGAVAHHATGGERRPRAEEARRFARRIARELAQAQQQDRCDRLVLIAGPRFLGTLRAALRKSVRDTVEVPRDLVHQGEEAVRQHLPGELFKPAASPGPQP